MSLKEKQNEKPTAEDKIEKEFEEIFATNVFAKSARTMRTPPQRTKSVTEAKEVPEPAIQDTIMTPSEGTDEGPFFRFSPIEEHISRVRSDKERELNNCRHIILVIKDKESNKEGNTASAKH